GGIVDELGARHGRRRGGTDAPRKRNSACDAAPQRHFAGGHDRRSPRRTPGRARARGPNDSGHRCGPRPRRGDGALADFLGGGRLSAYITKKTSIRKPASRSAPWRQDQKTKPNRRPPTPAASSGTLLWISQRSGTSRTSRCATSRRPPASLSPTFGTPSLPRGPCSLASRAASIAP